MTKHILAMTFACFLMSTAISQAATTTDVQDFVRIFNTGKPAAIAAYLHAHVGTPPGMGPPATTAADLVQLRSKIGIVKLESMRDFPRRITVTVKAKQGWYGFQFMKARPGRGAPEFLGLSAGLAPPPRASNQGFADYLKAISPSGYFSGVALVVESGSRPWQAAYGLANRETHAAITTGTRFNVASIGKLFTTAAIYQLVESGKLHLSDTIGQWLPDYPNKDAQAAKVQQLLDMSSGIGDFFNPKFMHGDHAHISSLQDYLPFFASDPLLFAPGTGRAYSNGGFLVLGLIVEKASGENFYSYVQTHIFNPAGMTHTSYPMLNDTFPDRAVGYTRQRAEVPTWSTPLSNTRAGEPGRGSSAGGAYSTVGDLYKFVLASRNGTLVKGSYPWNTFGVWAGGAPGWNGVVSVDDGVTTIVLSNQDPPIAEYIVDLFANNQ